MFNADNETYVYTYNANGERIRKANTETGEGDYYLRDYLGRTLVVYDFKTDEPIEANIIGNDLIGQIKVNQGNDSRYYYLKDHLSNIRCMLSAEGIVQSAQDYYPYGEIIREYNVVSSKYKFTEKERDTESTYDYFGARYYDSKLGMWLQVDPLSEKYPGWSSYNYTLNNPLKFIDKDGKGPDPYSTYILNKYNSLWNKGSEIAHDFTFNTLPIAFDYIAFGTAFWAPEVSLLASGASTMLTVSNDLKENGAPTTDSFVSTVTTVAGTSKNKAVAGTAAAIQIIYDTMKDAQTDDNKTKDSKEKQKERDEKTKKALNEITKKNEELKQKEEHGKKYLPISPHRYNHEQ